MNTYRITIDITSATDPREWNWDNFLNCDLDEDYYIQEIKEIKQ